MTHQYLLAVSFWWMNRNTEFVVEDQSNHPCYRMYKHDCPYIDGINVWIRWLWDRKYKLVLERQFGTDDSTTRKRVRTKTTWSFNRAVWIHGFCMNSGFVRWGRSRRILQISRKNWLCHVDHGVGESDNRARPMNTIVRLLVSFRASVIGLIVVVVVCCVVCFY